MKILEWEVLQSSEEFRKKIELQAIFSQWIQVEDFVEASLPINYTNICFSYPKFEQFYFQTYKEIF